jgi:hypothetical protein
MNVLLIYPEFPDTFWSFKHALKFVHKKAAFPPLGLLTLGAMLPKKWSTRLIDLNVEKLTEEDLAWADWVFISAMAVQRDSARQNISRCKEANVKVVAGGPLFASEYKKPKIDIPFDFNRFLAFFRSSIRLGIFGNERFQYWRLLWCTLFRRPGLLTLAITFSIYGYHFRRVCDLHIL